MSPLEIFKIIPEVLDNAIRQEKGNQRYTGWEGKHKTDFVHRLNDHLHRKSKRINNNNNNKPLKLIHSKSKVVGYNKVAQYK